MRTRHNPSWRGLTTANASLGLPGPIMPHVRLESNSHSMSALHREKRGLITYVGDKQDVKSRDFDRYVQQSSKHSKLCLCKASTSLERFPTHRFHDSKRNYQLERGKCSITSDKGHCRWGRPPSARFNLKVTSVLDQSFPRCKHHASADPRFPCPSGYIFHMHQPECNTSEYATCHDSREPRC